MIDTPEPNNDADQSSYDLEGSGAIPLATYAAKSHQHSEGPLNNSYAAKYAVRALKAVEQGTLKTVNWIDSKGPFISAIATVVIAFLTGVYVHWSHAQWSVMNSQLREMQKQTAQTQIAAAAAKESADLTRKQMEVVGAAVVEFNRNQVGITFPTPPNTRYGQVGYEIVNVGHVIARDTHIVFSMSIKSPNGYIRRTILSKVVDNIATLSPSDLANIPGRSYNFELSPSEITQAMNTDTYISVSGTLDYDNGFETRISQPFCFTYIWGTQWGKSQVTCNQIDATMREVKNYKTPQK